MSVKCRAMKNEDTICGVDFSGSNFVIRAALIGSSYSIVNQDKDRLLQAKRNRSNNEVRYIYYDPNDAIEFELKGGEWGKRSTEFNVVNASTETAISKLSREDPDSQYRWQLTVPDDDKVQAVISRDTSNGLFDTSGWDFPIIAPMSMTATKDEEEVAVVKGRPFSTRFTFDLKVHGLSGIPKATVVLAVPALYETMRPETFTGG